MCVASKHCLCKTISPRTDPCNSIKIFFRWLRKAIEVPSAIYHYTEAFEENTDNDEYEEDEDEEGGDDLDPFVTPGRDPCREALYNLGVMQLISGGGGGVGIHLKREAAKWFALAAEKGVMDSGYEMGRMV